jgi:hypothetical protein
VDDAVEGQGSQLYCSDHVIVGACKRGLTLLLMLLMRERGRGGMGGGGEGGCDPGA